MSLNQKIGFEFCPPVRRSIVKNNEYKKRFLWLLGASFKVQI